MRNITPPVRDDIRDYRSAIARRRPEATRVVLGGYTHAIEGAYATYTGLIEDVIGLTPMILEHPDHSDLLQSNYGALSDGRALQDLAAELHEVASFRCPMCNFEQASTLDHFLPRATYPEFSVLARNLVAACFTCNNRKGAQSPSRFVHPYLDQVPDLQIVIARMVWDPELHLEYSLMRPRGMGTELFARLSEQFQRLELGERLGREAVYVLTEIKLNCERPFRRGGAGLVRKELLRQANDSQLAYGINHYKPALLTALATDNRFCDGGFRDEVRPG